MANSLNPIHAKLFNVRLLIVKLIHARLLIVQLFHVMQLLEINGLCSYQFIIQSQFFQYL